MTKAQQVLPPKVENIPPELRSLAQWVCWRTTPPDERGKFGKQPIDVHNGRLASSTDPATWSTFDAAVRYYREHDGQVAGVGFVFAAGGGLVGVDVDDCLVGAQLDELGREFVEGLHSYWEVSPSGRGIKGIAQADIELERNRSGRVEVYNAGRFFTLTGHRWPTAPAGVQCVNGELHELVAKYLVAPSKTMVVATGRATTVESVHTDGDVVAACRQVYGGKFYELYDRASIGAYGDDDSAADLALANMLAYVTQDPAQVERILSGSALGQREKWLKRQDYRDRTIGRAIGDLGKVYTWPGVEVSGENAAATTTVAPSTVAEKTAPAHRTDLGNSQRLAQHHGDDLLYIDTWGKWFVWTGKRWEEDKTREVYRRARDTVRRIYAEAAGLAADDARRELGKWAAASESRTRIDAMIALAKAEPIVAHRFEELDRDGWLLNVDNGVLDLRTGKLRPHRREDLLTKMSPVAYDPSAEAPLWTRFLHRVMDGNDELITFLQRSVGYTLTADTTEHCLFFLYGRGRNGKSTFTETIRKVMGDYAQKAPRELVQLRTSGSDGVPNDLARLPGMRFVFSSELEEARRLDEPKIKDMTGGDTISARFMHGEFFDFQATHKLWLYGNHKPEIAGTDEGIWSRINLVPFTVFIPNEERDPDLPHKLEAELPGILRWAVEGCLEWQRHGLGVPSAVAQATAGYRAEMDTLARFIDERCIVGPRFEAKFTDLYDAYTDWCDKNGEKYPAKSRKFADALSERGYVSERGSHNVTMRRGIGLLADVDEPDREVFKV